MNLPQILKRCQHCWDSLDVNGVLISVVLVVDLLLLLCLALWIGGTGSFQQRHDLLPARVFLGDLPSFQGVTVPRSSRPRVTVSAPTVPEIVERTKRLRVFASSASRTHASDRRSKTPSHAGHQGTVQVLGVIRGPTGGQAILRFPDGETHLVGEGGGIAGRSLVVESIEDTSVLLRGADGLFVRQFVGGKATGDRPSDRIRSR